MAKKKRESFRIEGLGDLTDDEIARAYETAKRLAPLGKAGEFGPEVMAQIVQEVLDYRKTKRALGWLFQRRH